MNDEAQDRSLQYLQVLKEKWLIMSGPAVVETAMLHCGTWTRFNLGHRLI
jgi:hypothetical protein